MKPFSKKAAQAVDAALLEQEAARQRVRAFFALHPEFMHLWPRDISEAYTKLQAQLVAAGDAVTKARLAYIYGKPRGKA